MFEQLKLEHHIQRYIVGVLIFQKVARFRDLRPPKIDTNLFSYHLKLLLVQDILMKVDGGYTLSQKGMSYVDRVSTEKFTIRSQPKIITMLVIQNSNGDVLLQKRTKQPYIDTWTLPYGKMHIEDNSTQQAAQREVYEKLGLQKQVLRHAGDCYIRVKMDHKVLSSTLAHVFTFNTDEVQGGETIQWVRPHELSRYDLSPAVEEITARTFFRDDHFFEEFEHDWRG